MTSRLKLISRRVCVSADGTLVSSNTESADTHPLCVTRHWRRPSLRKMSTTISMGVWSVTVKGLMSRMLRSFSGRGLSAGRVGACWVKYTREFSIIPSCLRRVFSEETRHKRTSFSRLSGLFVDRETLMCVSTVRS